VDPECTNRRGTISFCSPLRCFSLYRAWGKGKVRPISLQRNLHQPMNGIHDMIRVNQMRKSQLPLDAGVVQDQRLSCRQSPGQSNSLPTERFSSLPTSLCTLLPGPVAGLLFKSCIVRMILVHLFEKEGQPQKSAHLPRKFCTTDYQSLFPGRTVFLIPS